MASYTIPFTEQSVHEEICGRTMSVGRRRVGTHSVQKVEDVVLLSVGRESKWRVDEGRLCLMDERGADAYVVNAVEVENGVPFLSGDALRTQGSRVVMYERKRLEGDFHVFVSSHVDYESVTLPVLIRSLAREGVPAERVTVVVGGAEGEVTAEKGYARVPVRGNLMGCTALVHLLSDGFDMDSSYALVMHDTCEVMPGFSQAIRELDVGLPFDIVEGTFELGLWSKAFLARLRAMPGVALMPAYKMFGMLSDMCRLSRRCEPPNLLRSRDVYGGGVSRKVFEIAELGIRKYAGEQMTGGRP